MVDSSKILDALSGICVPSHSADIVAQGRVSGIKSLSDRVELILELSPSETKHSDVLQHAIEKVLASLVGERKVSILITSHQAYKPAGSHSPLPPSLPSALEHVRYIIAIASGKGGVGKSTTAVNIAVSLKLQGLAVGLLDADIYGPSVPMMMGIHQKPEVTDDRRLIPLERHGVLCMSMGFMVPEGTPLIWRGPMVQSALKQMLCDVAWGVLDILVIDMPPGTGDVQLTLAQQANVTGVVIVSTPQDIALLDASKGLRMFQKVDIPVIGLIETMSLFTCPNCHTESPIFGHGTTAAHAESLGLPFLGEVPLELAIREASDQGTPVVISDSETKGAIAYRHLANLIWESLVAK